MSRTESVDVLRTLAIVAVIVIHTTPFETESSPIGQGLNLATAINQAARFAVPFFFVVSGYFWANKLKDGAEIIEPTVRMARRIALLFVAWSMIYLLPMNIADSFSYGAIGPIKVVYWNLANAAANPLETLMQGTKVHLWFLIALLCSLIISAAMIRFGLIRLLVLVAVVLYLTGLAGKAYRDTPIGFHMDFNFRNGPFFSLIFFVTGYFLHRSKPSSQWLLIGGLLFFLGALLHFTELLVLNHMWRTTLDQDYVLGTYFFGTGAALIALSSSRWLHIRRAASIGPLVLGIYTSHFIFVELLKPLDRRYTGNAMWEALYVIAVFLLSYMMATILSSHRLTRRLVV